MIERAALEERLSRVLPEPIGEHFVVVSGRRFPPKQVIGLATGIDRADFNTHQARQILSRLGFTVGRRSQESASPPPQPMQGPYGGREAEALRPFMGKWVAQKGIEVLVAADTPQEVVRWLEEHNQWADGMFRVPRTETEASGLAPS
jgi:hypothetical protein